MKKHSITIDSVQISIQDICYSVGDKKILKGITGSFRSGRITAVMGASGAGKTTLLNILAGETRGTGSVLVNGQNVNVKDISGFVFQDDVILETMTVREAVYMSAKLRLSQKISDKDKMKKVDEVLDMLRLTKAADTIIGSTTTKGVSGGERKRTALAMEMVTDPPILFLDEPTSGLDTFTAATVIEILKSLAKSGRTVIATIHQPSSDIFHMFDDICLLAEGRVMYFGEIEHVVNYFGALGYQCPKYTNPADYIFMSILNQQNKTTDSQRISTLLDAWQGSREAEILHKQAYKEGIGYTCPLKYKSGVWPQFKYLFMRAGKNAMRNKFIIKTKFAQTIFVALLISLIYKDVRSGTFDEQAQNISGVMFFIAINLIMGSSISILNIFAGEKAVFVREFSAGYYSLFAYFSSKILVELPFGVLFPIIQAAIIYWIVGLATLYWFQFVYFTLALVVLSNCGSSLGLFFASVFPDIQVALAVMPVILMPLMIFSGLFVNNGSIPVYFDWIKWISPIKYGFEALIKNEYYGWKYRRVVNNQTVVVTGDDMVDKLGLDDGLNVAANIAIIFALYVILLVFSYVALLRTAIKSKA